MPIYIYFENESTWYMSPESPTVHVVTQLWWGRCFAGDQRPASPAPRTELGAGAAPAPQPLPRSPGDVWDVLMHFHLRSFWHQRLWDVEVDAGGRKRAAEQGGVSQGTVGMGRAGAARFIYFS